jgi:hypothetical protein
MDFNEFESRLRRSIRVGEVLRNPKKGTSEIISITGSICYKRRNSCISLVIRDMYETYLQFAGKDCSSNDLKEFMPAVYNSKARRLAGHSCNCTFLFLVLRKMCLAENIEGAGIRGAPFHVKIVDSLMGTSKNFSF